MGRHQQNTKGRIIAAAWELFYERGYESTTVDEIISASQTSKGSFYHYFSSKDALLGSLSYLFDEKYEALTPMLSSFDSDMERLLFLNRELFTMIEDRISLELLTRLFSSQLVTKGEKQLLDRSRYYFRLLRQICAQGQNTGEFRNDLSVNDLVKLYAISERSLIYDWCICSGEYSLNSYGSKMMPILLSGILK